MWPGESWKPSAVYPHLRDPDFFFFFFKISKYLKKWLDFVKCHAGQAKHMFRVPEETLLTMAMLCGSNPPDKAKMYLSIQESRQMEPMGVCIES